jgi:hypothetical protein
MARPADPFAQHGAQALVGNSLRDVNCHVANLRRTGRTVPSDRPAVGVSKSHTKTQRRSTSPANSNSCGCTRNEWRRNAPPLRFPA